VSSQREALVREMLARVGDKWTLLVIVPWFPLGPVLN
jgi:hypothetical protein